MHWYALVQWLPARPRPGQAGFQRELRHPPEVRKLAPERGLVFIDGEHCFFLDTAAGPIDV